jgi:Flp pilus assembly protein TadD
MENKPYSRIRQSFVKVFTTEILQMTGKQILSLYEQTKAKESDRFAFDSEELLNEVGYDLLRQAKYNDAVEIFATNTTLFPTSANAFDSLGEAYLRSGDRARALVSYHNSLKLNPQLESAKKMIAELEK